MKTLLVPCVLISFAISGFIGCATGHGDLRKTVLETKGPAWSLKNPSHKLVVAVSPAGKTLRIAGSSGLLVGAVIDASVNAKYQDKLEELLKDYDPATVAREIVEKRLREIWGDGLREVSPLTSVAGYRNEEDAQHARLTRLGKDGITLLTDLSLTYGIYGPEATLAAKVSAKVLRVPDGKIVWRKTIVAPFGPLLADARLKDPTDLVSPDVSSGLKVNEDAVKYWLADNGTVLKESYESLIDGVVSAMLCDLQVSENAAGYYYLGKHALLRRDYKTAEEYFHKALQKGFHSSDATDGRSIATAKSGNIKAAIELTKQTCSTDPQHGPSWYNLAWWYSTESHDLENARTCYEKALSLGMPTNKKIENILSDNATQKSRR